MISVPSKPKLTNSAYWNSGNSAVFFVGTGDKSIALDVVTFEYSISQQKLPIYGYKSVTWDTVMKGTELVQGTMAVSVSEKNYFYDLFNNNSTQDPALLSVPGIKDQGEGGVIKQKIDIYMGLTKDELYNRKDGLYATIQKEQKLKLEWLVINSIQQTVSPTSEQVLDIFSFIAKTRKDL